MPAGQLTSVIDRLARRLRLVRTLEHLVRFSLGAAGLVFFGLLWDKFQPLSAAGWQLLLAAALLLVVVGVIAGLLHPVSRLSAAKRADVRLNLADRLGNSFEFSSRPHPTPFMLAHIAETSRHLHGVRPGEAVPFHLPRRLPLLAVALVVLGLLLVVPGFKTRAPAPDKPHSPALPPMRFAGERTVDAMLATLDARRNRRLADVMAELKRLYAELGAGKLSRDEVLARVGEVDARLNDFAAERSHGRTAHTWRAELEKALAEKGAVLARNPASASLGRAMAEAKLNEASEQSRSLAEQAAGKVPTLQLTPEQSAALAKVMRKAAATGGRTLDVLSRHMDDAARGLTVEDLKRFAEGLEQMAREMERLAEEMEKMKGLARVDEELEELKEIVAQLAPDGEGRWVLGLAGGGRVGAYLEARGAKLPGSGEGEAKPGVGDTAEGPGTGGEPRRTEVERAMRALSGVWGDGASLIEVVRGAAGEGIATTAYRDAAEAAAQLAEDAVHSEDIPLGYRFYVKRYFQIIRTPAQSGKESP